MRKLIFFLLLYVVVGQSHLIQGQEKQTYSVGQTKYIVGENYKTTGYPKVERSSSAKKEFLRSKGYDKVPRGYQIDHIIPLSQGGKDEPSNMQLLSTREHKIKTAKERSVSTYSRSPIPQYGRKSKTYKSTHFYSTPTYNFNSSRPVMTGPRGGKYYINSKGTKTYIRKK